MPNLDFVIDGDRVVFLESKTTEYLTTSHSPLAPAYRDRAREVLSQSAAQEAADIVDDPDRYWLLDAPQLIKHLLAARTWLGEHPQHQLTLVYAYWEPRDATEHPAFGHHRDEIARFLEPLTSEPDLAVVARSWPDLWESWRNVSDDVSRHVDHLVDRYGVSIADS